MGVDLEDGEGPRASKARRIGIGTESSPPMQIGTMPRSRMAATAAVCFASCPGRQRAAGTSPASTSAGRRIGPSRSNPSDRRIAPGARAAANGGWRPRSRPLRRVSGRASRTARRGSRSRVQRARVGLDRNSQESALGWIGPHAAEPSSVDGRGRAGSAATHEGYVADVDLEAVARAEARAMAAARFSPISQLAPHSAQWRWPWSPRGARGIPRARPRHGHGAPGRAPRARPGSGRPSRDVAGSSTRHRSTSSEPVTCPSASASTSINVRRWVVQRSPRSRSRSSTVSHGAGSDVARLIARSVC